MILKNPTRSLKVEKTMLNSQIPILSDKPKKQPRILAVDDEPYMLMIIKEFLDETEYQVETATNGEEAWNKILKADTNYDLVLLDWMMPKMSGLEILEKIQHSNRLHSNQIIMQTARANPREIQKGINAGAYFYLTKPFKRETLLALIKTALIDRNNYLTLQQISSNRDKKPPTKRFTIRSLEETHNLAKILAALCHNPGSVGVGFLELLINAVEHGNLGITYEEKTMLISEGMWEEEIKRRLKKAEYRKKLVIVHYHEDSNNNLVFTMRDDGHGFNWQKYLEIDPLRVTHLHGRGIAMAKKISFDTLEYNQLGNQVTVTVQQKN